MPRLARRSPAWTALVLKFLSNDTKKTTLIQSEIRAINLNIFGTHMFNELKIKEIRATLKEAEVVLYEITVLQSFDFILLDMGATIHAENDIHRRKNIYAVALR